MTIHLHNRHIFVPLYHNQPLFYPNTQIILFINTQTIQLL